MLKLRVYAFFFLTIFISCEGKKEAIPAYITINDISFTYDNVSTVGNGGTAITDAWVYDNNNLLGVFELPATIAVAFDGTHDIRVDPGIKLNGISSTREAYPFYRPWIQSSDLTSLDTVYLQPSTSYYAEIGISFKEEFEDVVVKIDTASYSDVALVRTLTKNDPSYLGRFVGKVTLTADATGFKAYNPTLFLVPTDSPLPIYLELDYKCNQEFTVGSIVQMAGQGLDDFPIITLRSTEIDGELQWKHIYIDLTDYFAGQVNATGFGFSFTAFYNSGNTEGLIYLDNVKIVNTI